MRKSILLLPVLCQHLCHPRRNKVVYGQALCHALAYLRAADIDEWHAQKTHIGRQRRLSYTRALAGIDYNVIICKNLVMGIPIAKTLPVVSTDDEGKGAVGIVTGKRLQGVPCIRRLRQMELIITCHQTWNVLHGGTRQLQPPLICHQIGVHLPWILWSDHQPHLVEPCHL